MARLKPKFISPCVAEKYTRSRLARIAEFSNNGWGKNGLQGGLISLTNHEDGDFVVNLYSLDPQVKVSVDPRHLCLTEHDWAALEKIIEERKKNGTVD